MSLKKMHEEMKETRRSSQPQESSSTDSMTETQSLLIERQRQRIERLEKDIEQLGKEYREKLEWKEEQRKRAVEEADKFRYAPPKKELVYRYEEKCTSCHLEDYARANKGAWRYARFLTVMLIAGIICEIIQSRAFLIDLLEFFSGLMALLWLLTIGAVISGHFLAQTIGWLDPARHMLLAGNILRIALPLLIFAGYVLFANYVIPEVINYFKETEEKCHVPRMIGLHVFCAGIIIALCCARLIPESGDFRFNSTLIPIILYAIWFVISRYYEGGWWFKGWNEYTKSWW